MRPIGAGHWLACCPLDSYSCSPGILAQPPCGQHTALRGALTGTGPPQPRPADLLSHPAPLHPLPCTGFSPGLFAPPGSLLITTEVFHNSASWSSEHFSCGHPASPTLPESSEDSACLPSLSVSFPGVAGTPRPPHPAGRQQALESGSLVGSCQVA